VALRRGDLRSAALWFGAALTHAPNDVDALTGQGMTAYRAGDLGTSRRAFEHVRRLAPNNPDAIWYLARLPGAPDDTIVPHRDRPSQTVVAARTGPRRFEIPDGHGGWRTLWVKAVNLGAALPGKHPSEFPPNDSTYERWIALVAGMHANAIRVYTIHPPHFYRALLTWNLAHPTQPIWLIHGVWTELPPGSLEEQYDDSAWKQEFHTEMHRVVNLIHGSAWIPPRPGHAFGKYNADVSPWTLAYIIGREWEPYSVVAYSRQFPTHTAMQGRYISASGGNAMDVWLATFSDAMVGYEMDRYNTQRPIAYTNWPTLDPLTHPTESTHAEEKALLQKRREKVPEESREFDNDAISLDATKLYATTAYSAGVFASYHAYPYYPDFLVLDSAYNTAHSQDGPSAYYGYLRALVDYHGTMPVLISEFGVPSSRSGAHWQPQGWNHGGHSEASQATIDARLTRDIYHAGAAGAGLFALIDEWFKKNWIVIDFEWPLERNRLWLNALDAEQNYGVIAMRPGSKDSALVIDGKGDDWRGRGTWYTRRAADSPLPAPLRVDTFAVWSDEAYVYFRLNVGAVDWTRGRYLIGIDTYRADLGDTRLPYTGATSPVGLEFVLDLHGPEGSHLLVDHPYNLYRSALIEGSSPPAMQSVYNRPFRTRANADGRYDSLVVTTNRRRVGRDGRIYPARTYDRNVLLFARQTETTLADWYADTATGTIEVRIPWGMLHVLDPSSRQVLYGNERTGEVEGATTDGFRFVVQSYDPRNPRTGGAWLTGPRGAATTPPTWSWATWEIPRWHAEIKPVFDAMRQTFDDIP
jgi:hypothetical protein